MFRTLVTRQRRYISSSFLLLGAQTGVRAVGISDIYLRFGLDPLQLGLLSTVGVAAGIVTLVVGGPLIERFGRRPILIIGLAVTGLAYVLTAVVSNYLTLLLAWLLYGLSCSFIDLGCNTVASDFERATNRPSMTAFHSWFSLGAAVGALAIALSLSVGTDFRPGFVGIGCALLVLGLLTARAALPSHHLPAHSEAGKSGKGRSVARIPGVLLATAIVFTCFFGDGILETFLSTYVRVDSTALIAGLSIATFHGASWIGRMVATPTVRRFGDRSVLIGSGLLAAVAILAAIAVHGSWTVTIIFAVVGLAISPIVPLGFSLAGRSAPHQTARAVGFVTAVGYSAFLLSPLAAGALADLTSLGWGIAICALTTGAVALLAMRLPRTTSRKEQ